MEYPLVVVCMAYSDEDGETGAAFVESTGRCDLCTGVGRVWVLFQCDEALCSVYITRGELFPPLHKR